MRQRILDDVSGLPTYSFGPRMTMWWGTAAFILLEGTGFALAAGAYLFLVFLNTEWPLSLDPPGLLWSGQLTALLLVSLWPNQIAKWNARHEKRRSVQRDLVIMSLVGVAALAIRAFEFTTLNVRWDQNAYGSIIWMLLGLHTVHLLTDVVDTLVLTALFFTRHAHSKRFSDAEDNAIYWDFVVLAWLPIYALVYWVPRL
jgi:cytochrome c oxidase subunit III